MPLWYAQDRSAIPSFAPRRQLQKRHDEQSCCTASHKAPNEGRDRLILIVPRTIATKHLRQCERHYRIGAAFIAQKTSTGSCDNDVLLAVFAHERYGSGVGACINFRNPKFLASFGVEGAETAVVSNTDEDQAAGRCYRTTQIRAACILLSFRQRIRNPQGDLPGNITCVDVDGK